jgi:hypothetical protein
MCIFSVCSIVVNPPSDRDGFDDKPDLAISTDGLRFAPVDTDLLGLLEVVLTALSPRKDTDAERVLLRLDSFRLLLLKGLDKSLER